MTSERAEKIKFRHNRRFDKFSYIEIPEEKKYFESKKASVIILGGTVVIFGLLFYFTDFKDMILKIGIFAILFNLYKMYQAFFVPLLVINKIGIELRVIKIPWKKIKKIKISWLKGKFHLRITLTNSKIVNEEVESFLFMDYIYLHATVRGFKKKYRNTFTIKIDEIKTTILENKI